MTNNGWQDISTAPRMTKVLLTLSCGAVVTGFYGPKLSAYGVNYGDDWGHGFSWGQTFDSVPTHWQPLPEPPEVSP